tara:strand:- start:466 stop:909 length:444 start_codon:yes stop_codon:yes gene_type:complete
MTGKVSGCPHLDGFRAELSEDTNSNSYNVDLLFYTNGEETKRWRLARYTELEYAEARRFWGLLAAMARFATLGGDIRTFYAVWDNWPDMQVNPALPLAAVESDELYIHTYQLPDGKFLRVYEDETYEVLDDLELRDLISEITDELEE